MAIATPNRTGGYEYKFVDTTPDRYVCNICHLPSRDPYLTTCCGHVFCKSCLDNIKKAATVTNACPICRDEEFVTFPNKQLDREVKSLHVMCTNKDRGCDWHGELNDIKNHLGNSDGCQFEDVKCSNECGKMLQRRYLTSHVETMCVSRKVDCQYCHITGEHQFIVGEHKEQCSKLSLPCPNKCEVGSVPREDMEAHRKECPLEMIQCEYHNVGCEERIKRKDVEKHADEKMKEHLSLTKCRLTASDKELSGAKSQLTTAMKQINTLMLVVQTLVPQDPDEDACVVDSDTWFLAIAKRCIELTAAVAMTKSGNQVCPVTVSITEFHDKKADSTIWCSDAFYTDVTIGYKMCLCVYPAGNRTSIGTHLSVYLCLMKGPHDDELAWPLRGEFEVTLLNQISDCDHYSSTVAYDDRPQDDSAGRVTDGDRARGWGRQQFISNEELHKVTLTCQYLKGDCIFLQVSKV